MKKFLALLSIFLALPLTSAIAQNQPPTCGTISSKQYSNSEWTAGLEYGTGIRPGTPGACEAPGGNTCYWVDCDAVSDGSGTFASPYWGFETVFGYDDFTPGIINGGDWVYVKGTCDTFTDSVTGPLQLIRSYRRSQHGTVSEPTVITSWAGEAAPLFDGGFNSGVEELLRFQGVVGGGTAGYVNINNIKITRAYDKGIVYWEDVVGGEVNSLECYNGNANGISGESGCVSFFIRDSFTHTYSLDNSYLWDINASPSGSTNNQGAVAILLGAGGQSGNSVQINNTIIADTIQGVRVKHNGPGSIVVNESLIFNVRNGGYARGDLTFQKTIVQNASEAAIYLSEENQNRAITATINKCTLLDTTAYFKNNDGEGSGAYNSGVSGRNSIYQDLGGHTKTICLDCEGAGSPSSWTLSDVTHSHNMYNIASGSLSPFAEIEANTYTYAAFLSGVSDITSTQDDAELQSDCSILVTSPAATFANDGGAAGAVEPAGGAIPVVTINSLTTTSTSPQLTGTVDDASATISVTVDGNTYPGTNNGNGTWKLTAGTITPALSVGTYDVTVDATNSNGTGSDSTIDELVIEAASSGSWIGSFARRICRWCF